MSPNLRVFFFWKTSMKNVKSGAYQRINTIWFDFLKYEKKIFRTIQRRIILWPYLRSVVKYLLTSNQAVSLQLSLLAVLSRSESCKCFFFFFLLIGYVLYLFSRNSILKMSILIFLITKCIWFVYWNCVHLNLFHKYLNKRILYIRFIRILMF